MFTKLRSAKGNIFNRQSINYIDILIIYNYYKIGNIHECNAFRRKYA